MKKLCFITAFAVFSLTSLNAQGNFEASAEVGIVIGDASDFTSLSLGAAVAYLFDVSDDFKVGPQVGYTNYFGKDFTIGSVTFKADDFGVIPILARAKLGLSDKLDASAGGGWAIFTGDGDGGEFTYNIGLDWNFESNWGIGLGFNSIVGDDQSIESFSVRARRTF